jgi:hypothetical protein
VRRRFLWLVGAVTLVVALVLSWIHPTPVPTTCPADPLVGVYSPSRLHVLGVCQTYSGTVSSVQHEVDGDYHVDVTPDPGYEHFLNQGNYDNQGGALVTEIMPSQDATMPIPTIGEHVTLLGTWVYDTNHGWNEIHPVFSINGTVALPPASSTPSEGDPNG